MSILSLRGVDKVFGSGADAVDRAPRRRPRRRQGEFVCIIGASGCGKSTILNLVAGLDRPTAGVVEVARPHRADVPGVGAVPVVDDRRPTSSCRCAWPVYRGRSARNASRELLSHGAPRRVRRKRPHQLSGGMRQRVALARAFAQDADVLLMDEPFGALDAMTRDVLHDELDALVAQRGLTVLFVTHNVREAVRLGDRIVVHVATARAGDDGVRRRPGSATAMEQRGVLEVAASVTAALARRCSSMLVVETEHRRRRRRPNCSTRRSAPLALADADRGDLGRRVVAGRRGRSWRRSPWPSPSGRSSCGPAGGPSTCCPAPAHGLRAARRADRRRHRARRAGRDRPARRCRLRRGAGDRRRRRQRRGVVEDRPLGGRVR